MEIRDVLARDCIVSHLRAVDSVGPDLGSGYRCVLDLGLGAGVRGKSGFNWRSIGCQSIGKSMRNGHILD